MNLSTITLYLLVFTFCCAITVRKGLVDLRELKKRYRESYTWLANCRITPSTPLCYPSVNRSALISSWLGYYACSVRRSHGGSTPATAVAAYEGSTLVMKCGLCVAPGDRVAWEHAEFEPNRVFRPLVPDPRYLTLGVRLTVYRVGWADSGAYRCNVSGAVGTPVFVDITDREYDVLQKDTSQFTGNFSNNLKIFKVFPGGLPCDSRFLPIEIKELPEVSTRNNEIMLGLCKVPCGNNHSKLSELKRQPPPPESDALIVSSGDRVAVVCPGTTLKDVPMSWRAGVQYVVPYELSAASDGRVYLNARDHIVFARVRATDAGLYSCWQGEDLAGSVRVIVRSTPCRYGRATLFVAVLALAMAFMKAAKTMKWTTQVTKRKKNY